MADSLLIKVQFPPGSLKKLSTVSLKADMTVRQAVQEIVKSGRFQHPENFTLYHADGTSRKWLEDDHTLADYGITAQSSISLKKRWQIAKVRMIMGASSWVQGLIIDIREPFSAFMPFAAKKFQLDSQIEQFGLFSVNNKKEPLPMDKSIFGLDLPAETEFILANKSQPIQEAPKPADDGPRKTNVNLMGTVTFDKKKRYVVLEGVTFTVYKDQKEIDKPVQTIDLAEFAVQVDEKEKKKWQFDIIHLKNKKDVHQFKLENDKELNTWLTAIESVCVKEAASGESTPKSPESSTKYFGAPLAKAVTNGRTIPYIVEHCIKYIDEKAIEVEGIFRLSGSATTIDKYREQFNQGIMVDLTNEMDPHTVAGLLKLYFREMPEPLLTFDLYDSFIGAQSEKDSIKRIRYLRHLISSLPEVNRATLKFLLAFLIRVEKHSDVNKMAMHNLATVFAPNLLQPRGGNMLQMVEDTPLVNGLVNTFIKDYDAIFGDEEPADVAPTLARASYDYTGATPQELTFVTGDLIKVLKQGDNNGWWYGELNGKKGLFPGSYVQLQTAAQNKRLKFIQDMNKIREKVAEEKKMIQELEAAKAALVSDMDMLRRAKELSLSESAELKRKVAALIATNPELSKFPSRVEVLYSQLEAYHKTKMAMLSSRQTLLNELSELKKVLQTEPKFKKIKDKLLSMIDALTARFDEENAVRSVVDDRKDQVFKDLTELRIIIGKSGASSTPNTPH